MTTYYGRDGQPFTPAPAVAAAHRALSIAAERIGANNHAAQWVAHLKAGRSPRTFRFAVTPEHRAIVDAMPRHSPAFPCPDRAAPQSLYCETCWTPDEGTQGHEERWRERREAEAASRTHPYSRPFDSRNGPCVVCGRYEEDGPHE